MDRRRDKRNSVELSGEIKCADLWTPLECKIVDMSDSGAKVETLLSVHLPKVFELRVPLEGYLLPVRQAWREGHVVGVEFAGKPKPYLDKLL